MISKENHPCFNKGACAEHGRIHLPVAPKCNVQCNFCNRKFDCVNESRPGVTSNLLSPGQALAYYREAKKQMPFLSVAGIAGPGDPFANPEETLETLALIRKEDPEILLCTATNGLNLPPYIDRLAELEVSHITVTVNAVDPEIGARIYSWFRYGKRARRGITGAGILLDNQLEAITRLKEKGILVKVNSIILPGINDQHIDKIAAVISEMGVDFHNCLPYYKTAGSNFEEMDEPSTALVNEIRSKSRVFLEQMEHCQRCRADAAGLLGNDLFMELEETMNKIARGPLNPDSSRDSVAVGTYENMLVNQHLGEAEGLSIYSPGPDGSYSFQGIRPAPPSGGGEDRWLRLAETLNDCHTLLVSGIGLSPRKVLERDGIRVFEVEGLIAQVLTLLENGEDPASMLKRECMTCGSSCSGTSMGCM